MSGRSEDISTWRLSWEELFQEGKKYTADQIAERLEISIYTVRRRIKDGRLPADKIAGRYVVDGREVLNFIEKEKTGELIYFTKSGERKTRVLRDKERFKEEVIFLVENGYVLANTEVARIYFEEYWSERKDGSNDGEKRI